MKIHSINRGSAAQPSCASRGPSFLCPTPHSLRHLHLFIHLLSWATQLQLRPKVYRTRVFRRVSKRRQEIFYLVRASVWTPSPPQRFRIRPAVELTHCCHLSFRQSFNL